MDGHFARGQIYGLFNYFYYKIGTLKFSSRLDFGGKGRAAKRKEKGVISKKKKKEKRRSFIVWQQVWCHFQAENCTKHAAEHVLTFLFLFFGDHSLCTYVLPNRG